MKKRSSRAVGQNRHDFVLRGRRLAIEFGSGSRCECLPWNIHIDVPSLTRVAKRDGDVESAGIESADDDLPAHGAIDDVVVVVFQFGRQKSRRNQDQIPLAGHTRNSSYGIFHNTECPPALLLPHHQHLGSCRAGKGNAAVNRIGSLAAACRTSGSFLLTIRSAI